MIQWVGNKGISVEGSNVLTFEVQGLEAKNEIIEAAGENLYKKYMNEYSGVRMKDFLVAAWGDMNNIYPQALYSTVSENKLIPQILQKQVEYMFGKGPYLYEEVIEGNEINRKPVIDDEISDWLLSWEKYGLKPVEDYILQTIQEYYHIPAIATKYHFSKSRRLVGFYDSRDALPIRGLEAVGLDNVRLATQDLSINRKLKDKDCKFVLLGDWLNPTRQEFEVYNRFDPATPFMYPTAVSFSKNKTFTKDIYPVNIWFEGLFHWIKGANLTPRYINSYLKNALNARVHVVIPGAWVEHQRNIIQSICEQNRISDQKQLSYSGVILVDNSTNTALEYTESMIEQLINNKLSEITKLMSGEGKNQGKLWASIKYTTGNGVDEWEFKEIPSNYKEFISSLKDYDSRADQVILAGVGINSSISNVEKDGVISKSGSDVFYNYMIYINNLAIPEYFILQDLNRAIALNFPGKKNIKIGLYHRTPPKTQDIAPTDRMENAND